MITDSYLYNNITSNTTTTVCGTACVLHSITVNTTAAGTIEIKDGNTTIGTLKTSVSEGTYTYDIVCNDSLVIVTGANSDITVSYTVSGS